MAMAIASHTAPADPAPARRAAPTIAFAWVAMLVSYLPFSAVNGALAPIGADTQAASATPAALAHGLHAAALLLVTVIIIASAVSAVLVAPNRRSLP